MNRKTLMAALMLGASVSTGAGAQTSRPTMISLNNNQPVPAGTVIMLRITERGPNGIRAEVVQTIDQDGRRLVEQGWQAFSETPGTNSLTLIGPGWTLPLLDIIEMDDDIVGTRVGLANNGETAR